MPIQKLPNGTRGPRNPPGFVGRLVMPLMTRFHKRSGDRFQGMDLLYLTTVGARSGQRRTTSLARVADGDNWLVVAAAAGAIKHPSWYHNVVAHPDDVWVEFGGEKHRVEVEQLQGEARERAWAKVVERFPRFDGYLGKTDREMPVLRLTPVP